ncbi:MAG: hypothetical protein KDJ36_05405 [Hyphomicrobiaceae bacterium]|nr:hypothetical protein [Hyphomicrobiaceae bacterium]
MIASSLPAAGAPAAQTSARGVNLRHLPMAIGVAIMVAGQLAAGLVAVCYIAAHLLHIPWWLLDAGLAASAATSLYVATLLIVRVLRVETQLERGGSENVSWDIWPPRH